MKEKNKNKVLIECSETFKKIKGKIINRNFNLLEVEMPTGCVLHMKKHDRASHYSFRIGMIEFLTDGIERF